jgi:hypothetical protein
MWNFIDLNSHCNGCCTYQHSHIPTTTWEAYFHRKLQCMPLDLTSPKHSTMFWVMTNDHSHYGLLLMAWVQPGATVAELLVGIWKLTCDEPISLNRKFIALAFMAHPNNTSNTRENNNAPYNASLGCVRQFDSPPQTLLLQQRAPTGQLNDFLCPSTPSHQHKPHSHHGAKHPILLLPHINLKCPETPAAKTQVSINPCCHQFQSLQDLQPRFGSHQEHVHS